MSSIEWRCAVAVVIGVALEALFIWRFLPYAQREAHHGLLPFYALPVLAFVAGLVLTLGLHQNEHLIPFSLVGGFCAANACLILVDCWHDPTNHNLWPFEFLMICVLTTPAFMGAGVSSLLHRQRTD